MAAFQFFIFLRNLLCRLHIQAAWKQHRLELVPDSHNHRHRLSVLFQEIIPRLSERPVGEGQPYRILRNVRYESGPLDPDSTIGSFVNPARQSSQGVSRYINMKTK
jgi:hypothetical protein